MPGNATLNSSVLVDDLVGLIDELRDDLHTEFGVRAYRVYAVTRTWDGGEVGFGNYTDAAVELTPQPKVLPFTGSLRSELRQCGLDEAGTVILKEVSLSYTYEELTGHPVTSGAEQSMAAGAQFLIRITEAHGQGQPSREFVLDGPPFPDREKDFGWVMQLTPVPARAA